MKKYSQDDFLQSLATVEISKGDIILIHSSLFSLGMLNHSNPETLCKGVYNILRTAIGTEGTLLVPAYFYEYARTPEPFDVKRSPVSKELGVFAQYVTALPDAIRSYNPLTSLAGIGPHAEYICRGQTATGYGVDSPWDRITRIGGKCLMLGVKLQYCLTYAHYIEQMFGVPHMYAKRYITPIYNDGTRINLPVVTYVRYLKYNINVDLSHFENMLIAKNHLHCAPLGSNTIYSIDCQTLFNTGIEALKNNIYFFLKHPPDFVQGEIPADEKIFKKKLHL